MYAGPRPTGSMVSSELSDVVQLLEGVPLERTGSAALFDRTDTKYILPAARIPDLLALCAPAYQAVDVMGQRLCGYSTLYFDSEDLLFYRRHHDGRALRHKVRIRTYEEPGIHFLEVKRRNNHGRTLKSRVPVATRHARELKHLANDAFRGIGLPVSAQALRPVLRVDYSRLTLVNRSEVERVTIDLRLRYTAGLALAVFPGLAIVELKQAHRAATPLRAALREMRVPEGGISKYCLGVVKLRPDARSNRFLPITRRVDALGAA